MTDKHIIKKFSDNHCLVLENNQISLREDEITAYQIVLGKSTNELLEFVKDTYLQLKAKEQECEELKKQLMLFMDGEYCANGCSLKQQLDQLKRDNDLFRTCHDNEQEKRRKHEQTLTEIKEIAENMNNECFYSDFDCKYCDMKNGCTYHRKIKILQKISECEVE